MLLSGVKRAFSSDPSRRGSVSRSGDNGSQDSSWSSSSMPSPHRTVESSHYPAHDDILETMNDDDISIRSPAANATDLNPMDIRNTTHLCS
jgi:hypothetical protein